MKPKRSLPILLVSACDRATAEEFISELIDNEISESDNEEKSGTSDERVGRVWRLVNKYYCADVLVLAHGDSDPPLELGARLEAHVAYFTSEEVDLELNIFCETPAEGAAQCAERRARPAAAVRVAALRAAREASLQGWAARARYEPVALQAAGVVRVRDALHAHPWPGLRRLDRAAPTLTYRDSDESSSGGEGEAEEEEGDEGDVERAEQFALALGALGEAGAGAGTGALGDAERRERAEQLLAAFCRALGHRLDC